MEPILNWNSSRAAARESKRTRESKGTQEKARESKRKQEKASESKRKQEAARATILNTSLDGAASKTPKHHVNLNLKKLALGGADPRNTM